MTRKAKKEEERSYHLVSRKGPLQRRKETGTFFKSFLRFLFSHVGLVLLCIVIAVGGAELYVQMETPVEDRRYKAKQDIARKVDDATEYMSSVFWWYIHDVDTYNFTKDDFRDRVDKDLNEYISYVLNATNDYGYDGYVEGWDRAWTLPNALLFTISIMTVIGYGHISPATLDAKMFTIGYSLVAIACMMIMLANVGQALAQGLIYLYSRFCCRCFRSARVNSEIPSRSLRKKLRRRLIDEDVGEELYMPTNTIAIPIIVNIVLIFGYVFLGATMFSAWEDWDFISATYFSFITLTTVGFGDLTPHQSFKNGIQKDATTLDQVKMVLAITYCSIGLAVLSMCISLIQEQVKKQAAKAIHGQDELVEISTVDILPKRKDIRYPDEDALSLTEVIEDNEEENPGNDVDDISTPLSSNPPTRPTTGKSDAASADDNSLPDEATTTNAGDLALDDIP